MARPANRLRVLALGAIAALLFTTTAAAPASASPWSGTEYKYTVISTKQNATNFNQQLDKCTGYAGNTCSFNQSYTVSSSVQTSFGLSKGAVSAGIGYSSTADKTVGVSCEWVLPFNTSKLIAYPMGVQTFYTITKNVYSSGKRTSSTTSGTLSAFVPYGAGMFCARIR